MKTLVAVLALYSLTYAQSCPKMSEITQTDINSVNTVALVTVANEIVKNVYELNYAKYFDVTKTPAPIQWQVLRALMIKCDDVKLDLNYDYILGCKIENRDCKFVRRYDKLTEGEKKLLKI